MILVSHLKKWLSSPRFSAFAVAIACVISLPALRTGLVADDIWHRAMVMAGRAWIPPVKDSAPWELYTFAKGTAEEHARIIESGFAPWWVSHGVRISFFRPVASLLIYLDYQLWPSSPFLMHAHSIAWYAIVVLLAAKLYQRLLGDVPLRAFTVGLATLFYALDPAHGLPVGWIANRNAVVCAAFALGALLLHLHSADSDGEKKKKSFSFSIALSGASAVSFAFALGAGEGAIGAIAFFAGHVLFLDERPFRTRIVSFVPHALVVVLWFLLYRAGNHGVMHSGVYVEPLHSPAAFVTHAIVHLPLLLGTELGGPPPDLYVFVGTPGRALMVVLACLSSAWAIYVITRCMRAGGDTKTRDVTRFFFFASILSTVPSVATFPSARLLMIPSFGFMGLAAIVCSSPSLESEPRLVRAYAKWMLFAHVALAPFLFVLAIHQIAILDGYVRRLSRGVPSDGSAVDKRLVIVNSFDTVFAYYMIIGQLEQGRSPPNRMLVMTGNTRDVVFTRTGERTIRVRCANGFYRDGTDLLFRDPSESLPLGTTVVMSDVTVTVTHVMSDGTADEASFEFTTAREDDLEKHFVFREWRGNEMVPFTLPPIGQTVTFPAQRPSPF